MSGMEWSKWISPLISFARALRPYFSRLHRERQASRTLFPSPEGKLIDQEFDKTLIRLKGEELKDNWLKEIRTWVEHPIVTPQFLREKEIGDWLSDEKVCDDLKTLASARLLEFAEVDGAVEERLIQAYVSVVNKHKAFAVEAIDCILNIMVAGYKESLKEPSTSLAGLTVAGFKESREALQGIAQEVSVFSEKIEKLGVDDLVVSAHTDIVTKELARILKSRGFRGDRAREEIRTLVDRILGTELRHVKPEIKAKAFYWAARLHTSDAPNIPAAEKYLHQLHQLDPTFDTRIVDALILEHRGNVDGALRVLRDIHTNDGHSNIWLVISRTRSKQAAFSWFEAQTDHNDPEFFTGIGWQNFSVTLAEMGMWEKAADTLASVQDHIDDWPDLAFVEGVINTAMLLPVEMRPLVFRMNVFHPQIHAVRGPDANQRRTRAYACFDRAARLMEDMGEVERAQGAKQWTLWLQLTDDNLAIRQVAQKEVREACANGRQAIDYLQIALAFNIDFDKGPLQRYLTQRKQMGGLEGPETIAELLLAETTMTAREYAEFLENDAARLALHVKKATLAGKRIEALLKDGQVARARHVFEEYRDEFIENDDERLRAMILKQEGGDVRTTLEENYARTGDLLDLQNLVQEVGRSSDWGALLPLLEDLFRRERTTGNACRLVECMQRHPKSGSAAIKAFFDNNQDVTQWNDDLKSSQAWALFHTGYLRAARTINDQLVKNRNNPTDLWLDMNLAIQAGDWERFPAIVEREWEKRDTYDPTLLLQLASLAAEADASANRAFELAKLAASKAPDDPSVLMKAYSLTVQLGRENDADPSWMTRAVELSSDSGPVHRVDMRTLVQKMMPAHRERERFIERNLLKGEVPLHVAASVLNMALSRILIDIPRRNAEQSDGRRRVIIPICSGARQSIGLQPSSVIGLDVTSLMLLGFLNLLRTVLNAFSRTVLAPETMVVLLNERRRVCFHQPSRIKNAEEIREIIEKGQLKPVKSSVQPPSWLVDEVGSDFAEMLEMARINHGYVVRPRPIYQLSTFLEKEADLKDYGQLILSTNGLAGLLVNAGKLSRELHEQAKKYLMAHDKGPEVDTRTISSIFAASFYLDDLAVTYLQQVGILQSVCRSGLDLWVHPSMREEQSTLVTAKRESERLNDRIDDIRCALREALDNGKIVFLPHHDEDENESVGSLTGFLSDSGLCSTVCIDDRYINRHGSLTDKKGNNIPITCVLDLIHYLEAQGSIDTAKKWDTLHRLREAGFSLIPIEPDELEHLLRAALFDQDNHLIESPELRIIRQQLMHIRSSGMIQNTLEAPYLTRLRLTCILNIRRLWQDENLSVDRTLTLTSWVWENLAPSPVDWEPNAQSAEANSLIRTAYIEHLTPLFSPLGRLTPVRYEAFLEWIERAVLEPLLPANNHLIDDVAEQLKIQIGQLVQRLSDGIDQSPNC